MVQQTGVSARITTKGTLQMKGQEWCQSLGRRMGRGEGNKGMVWEQQDGFHYKEEEGSTVSIAATMVHVMA